MLYYTRRVRYEAGRRVYLSAQERREGLRRGVDGEEIEPPRPVATLLIWRGEVASGAEAEGAVYRALRGLAPPGPSGDEVQGERGRALRRKARLLEHPIEPQEESLACLRAAGGRWGEARTLNRLAHLNHLLGGLDAARRHAEALLSIRCAR